MGKSGESLSIEGSLKNPPAGLPAVPLEGVDLDWRYVRLPEEGNDEQDRKSLARPNRAIIKGRSGIIDRSVYLQGDEPVSNFPSGPVANLDWSRGSFRYTSSCGQHRLILSASNDQEGEWSPRISTHYFLLMGGR